MKIGASSFVKATQTMLAREISTPNFFISAATRTARTIPAKKLYEILKALPEVEGCPYVFVSNRGKQLSDMAMSQITRRMKVNAVPHGFRSTFKDWARSSTSYADEVSELALAHVGSDATRAAYARDALLPKRARLMRDWAKFCGAPTKKAKVTPIRGENRTV